MGRYRKFIIALIGAVAVAINEGLLPDSSTAYLNVAIAFTTALGVYGIYNDTYSKGGETE